MLKVGDVVSLKSRGHAMTVVKELNSEWVRTVWFIEGNPSHYDFPVHALKKHN